MNWTRSAVDRETWEQAGERLRSGASSLLSLWGEPGRAHMAVIDSSHELRVLSFACEANRFPSIGRLHPPAIRLELAMRDLAGLEAEGLPDTRPWLRHGGPLPIPGSAIASATSGRAATRRRSASCMRAAACCASGCCARRPPALGIA